MTISTTPMASGASVLPLRTLAPTVEDQKERPISSTTIDDLSG